ncbi:MAG: TolC family protein [Alistipes sp.]|nr:TolC family protein [Alistipes sp.]
MKKFSLLVVSLCAICEVSAQVSLEAYRDSVFVNSYEIAIADEQISRAYSAAKKSYADFLPSLDAEASIGTSFRRVEDEKLWFFDITPRISQTLLGGGVRATYRQSQSQLRGAAYDAEYVRRTMLYSADYAYWSLSAMGLYREAVKEYVAIVSSLADIVKERFDAGYVAKSDLLQVEARRSEAEYALVASINNYDVALHRFNNLRGVEEPAAAELTESILDSLPMPRRVSYGEMLEARADVQSARQAIHAAAYGVDVTRAKYNPSVNMSVRGSWQTYSPNKSNRTFVDGALLLGVSVPIFHWGERRRAVAIAQSDLQIAEHRWEQICSDAEQEEADGWSALQSSYMQMQSSLQNLAIAQENLTISTYSYNEGQATVLDVLQAQISWLQIYTNAITARFNYAVAVSAYHFITSM